MYIYEQEDWPNFTWNANQLQSIVSEVRYKQGKLFGQMHSYGFDVCEEASFIALTSDVIKTSEIEGEELDKEQVRSSVARRLGLKKMMGDNTRISRDVEGIVEITLDATRNYQEALTADRLFAWHRALFSSGMLLSVGKWRGEESGPMQVISGPYGREIVHFEAPSYEKLAENMDKFLMWYNEHNLEDYLIKSAVAHFWFVTIHPFDDGNGRIARAIGDMCLARSENSKWRFYSVSTQIQKERAQYYNILEHCQKDGLDITKWIRWYLECLMRAIESSSEMLDKIVGKAIFWQKHNIYNLNERQRKVLTKMLEEFDGRGINTSTWAKIAKCSQDTALRDILALLNAKILEKEQAGGRSTRYNIISHAKL